MDVQDIGGFLKECRINKKLTQANVADMIGVSPQAISKWEKGTNMPDVAYFLDISRIYEISLEEILNSKKEDAKESVGFVKNLFDAELFESIVEKIENTDLISNIDINLDFFAYLSNEQKTTLVETIMKKSDYFIALDEILPYTNSVHKNLIISEVLEKKHYHLLEEIAVYMNNRTKELILGKLLGDSEYDIIEEIITIFNGRQRELITSHFIENDVNFDIIENFLPFFNQKQIQSIKELKI